ncbi:unnamed protein product, partial [Closterium sp. NIES-54]
AGGRMPVATGGRMPVPTGGLNPVIERSTAAGTNEDATRSPQICILHSPSLALPILPFTSTPRLRALETVFRLHPCIDRRAGCTRWRISPMRGRTYTVEELTEESFKGVDIALFSAGGSISKKFGPAAVAEGTIVVDNSSAFRMTDGVPLVVPEVSESRLSCVDGARNAK